MNSVTIQGFDGIADYADQIRLGQCVENIYYQDINLESAIDELRKACASIIPYSETDGGLREDYWKKAQESIKKPKKDAGTYAAISAVLSFATTLNGTLKSKEEILNDIALEDWDAILGDITEQIGISAVKGGAIMTLANCAGVSVPMAASLVSAVIGIVIQAIKLSRHEISFDDFMYNIIGLSVQAAVIGAGAAVGQALIPIPGLGAFIGSFVSTAVFNLVKKYVFDGGYYNIVKLAAYEKAYSDNYIPLVIAYAIYSSEFDGLVEEYDRDMKQISRCIYGLKTKDDIELKETLDDIVESRKIIAKKIKDPKIMSEAQLDDFAEFIINSEDSSKIVMEMVSLIQGNEADFARLKDQKWFERIWYMITKKNKATVKEMQERRDDLNACLIKVIIKLLGNVNKCSKMVIGLERACEKLGYLLNYMKVDVNKIEEDLSSLSTYTFTLTDIQNEQKYPAKTPLLSLIEIMSQLDYKTLKDQERLRQLKETMEKSGFSFSAKISAREHAKQVFNLQKERAETIRLFYKDYSERDRFLKYTCNLIENYFNLGKTARNAISSDEIIKDSLASSGLSDDSYCTLDDMYDYLKETIPERNFRLAQKTKNGKPISKDSGGKERKTTKTIGRNGADKNVPTHPDVSGKLPDSTMIGNEKEADIVKRQHEAEKKIEEAAKIAFTLGCIPGISVFSMHGLIISTYNGINSAFDIHMGKDSVEEIVKMCIATIGMLPFLAIPVVSGSLAKYMVEVSCSYYLNAVTAAYQQLSAKELEDDKQTAERVKQQLSELSKSKTP